MAVDVLTETTIALPCERVAAFAADPSNAPRWYRNIKSVTWRTPPPLAAAMRRANTKDLAGLKRLLESGEADAG